MPTVVASSEREEVSISAPPAEFCARVDAARMAGTRRLLLDLTQLRACDASGLRALIGAAAEVAASAGRVALVPTRRRAGCPAVRAHGRCRVPAAAPDQGRSEGGPRVIW